MKIIKNVVILSFLLILGACQTTKNKMIDKQMNFEVVQIDQQKVESLEVSINFSPEENRISGVGGCNSYTGTYSTENTKLEISKVVSTRKMCAQGMKIEQNLLSSFDKITHYKFDGKTLELKNDAQKTLVKASLTKQE
ncbi:META domain-containing protein [Mesonia aquimarina]|uniref:META domain-containing protein n=1 Tax=Mesonia aquimarina TaxID=1504967 RepID=UPI000EF573F8|nr:META domain-containing protein [Mesonia aquimarina]